MGNLKQVNIIDSDYMPTLAESIDQEAFNQTQTLNRVMSVPDNMGGQEVLKGWAQVDVSPERKLNTAGGRKTRYQGSSKLNKT